MTHGPWGGAGERWVPPQDAPAWQRRLRRSGGRARYLAAAALHGPLRDGPPIMLGPRSTFVFGTSGRFDRGTGLVLEDGFAGTFHAPVSIGSSVYVGRAAVVAVFAGLTIGDRTRLGERVSIHDEDHAVGPDGQDGYVVAPILIGSDVWVGAGAIVLRGSTIGDGAVVAAGAVVRGTVDPGTVVAGVPARPVGSRR